MVNLKPGLKLFILAAILAGAAAPAGAAEQQPKPARIDRNGVLILVRSTLIALDQANKTGNYTVSARRPFRPTAPRGSAKSSPASVTSPSISRASRCSIRN
jgi:hypothetical protein